ncbi:MAG: ThiF family adenylyltransferase, partial [Clostridia bacterium]|nr:ThiF family adenylyltransferase [Clostridia bacterium]
GHPKTTVAANRIADINPACNVTAVNCRFDSTTADKFDFASYDYVVDAIDTVTSKLLLVELCKQHNTPIIASMGTGNKLQSNFEVADIYQTSVCPLCKVMRKELKARNITSLKVVYSKDMPQQPLFQPEESDGRRQTPSSISFVPSAAGLLIAGEVIRDIIG